MVTHMKKLLLFTDAWSPQVNGVVTTLKNVIRESSWDIEVVNPTMFRTFSCPGYSEIKLSMVTRRTILKLIKEFDPDYIHISTEGPIGWQAYRACKKLGRKFTSSYHTRFPEYVNTMYSWIPTEWVYNVLRKLHMDSEGTLVPTKSIVKELSIKGVCNRYIVWGRGVDTNKFAFHPNRESREKLVVLYVGRISKEKNLEAFLDMKFDQPVEMRVVGKGPHETELKKKYQDRKEIVWVGEKRNTSLVMEYQNADVFVFPSKTDTFGLVMLEAMATGTPVVGYNVPGPKDVIIPGINGYIAYDGNLVKSVKEAIKIPRYTTSNFVSELSWKEVAQEFERIIEYTNNITGDVV